MADPIYEVKLKGDEADPLTPAKPSMSEEQIAALVDTRAQEKADSIATSKVEALKNELAESLSGKKAGRYGERGPESWEKFQDDTTERAVKIAEEKIEKRLEAERKANEEKQQLTQKQVEEQQKAEYARMSIEWQEAVADGVLPDISKEVKEKLQKGTTYEQLSDAERQDPGLKSYNEARLLHIQLQKEGKSNSFYRTASQFYRKQPAGARAPVIGGGIASPGSTDSDFSYDEVVRNRKSKFNF